MLSSINVVLTVNEIIEPVSGMPALQFGGVAL
jgi:hypothetical protein